MDFDRALGTEFRQVREVKKDGQPARAVEGSRVFAADIDDLWDAVTTAERLARWFTPTHGDLVLGGRYQLEGNAQGTITHCDPPHGFEVTWEFGDNVSWVSVRLQPEEGGVRLTLVHTMLQDEAGEAHWATYGAGATGVGWDLAFLGLGMHLASGGEAIERETSEAWLTAEAGKRFIRACAASWGDAHTASGEEAEIAQAMAARTASFYTGE